MCPLFRGSSILYIALNWGGISGSPHLRGCTVLQFRLADHALYLYVVKEVLFSILLLTISFENMTMLCKLEFKVVETLSSLVHNIYKHDSIKVCVFQPFP